MGLGRPARRHRGARCSQLASGGPHAHRQHQPDPGQQRVLRALHLQHLRAPRPQRRVHHCQQAPAVRPDQHGAVGQQHEEPAGGRQWLSERAGHPRRPQGHLQDQLGDQAADAGGHGGGPRRLHRPEPVLQRAHGGAHVREAHVTAFSLLAQGVEDRDVLPADTRCCRCDQVHGGSGQPQRGEARSGRGCRWQQVQKGTRYSGNR
mmetsp:Transcript_40088/g.103770  ORF Transcript_40088/g.103770 Transcript_40088/m.103770 type:complete len:205 (-) Transcript_40088:158-772(-)